MKPRRPLRAITYLAPGMPRELFELVSTHIAASIGRPIELRTEERISGPMHGDHDPFADGTAELGFLCSPSYLYLASRSEPSIALVDAGFVFDDARCAGRPLCFADVVVRAERPERSLAELAGARFGFNDRCSLSGYYAVIRALAGRGLDLDVFAERIETGSHDASLGALVEGRVDVAAIDSNVRVIRARTRPESLAGLRVVESLGPFPIQPIVVAASVDAELRARIEAALLALGAEGSLPSTLAALGLLGCGRVERALLERERRRPCELGGPRPRATSSAGRSGSV